MNIYLEIFLHTLPTLFLLGFFLIKQDQRITRLEESDIWIKKSLNNLPCIKNPGHDLHPETLKAQTL